METIAHTQRSFAVAAAGLFALTALLLASPAQATKLPADPMTFVGTPIALAQLVNDSHATNVWAALADLRSGR
ncbi:hypothetical protein ACVW00_001837 [Marmoricola sp. URHA0025 HA25]